MEKFFFIRGLCWKLIDLAAVKKPEFGALACIPEGFSDKTSIQRPPAFEYRKGFCFAVLEATGGL